MSGTKTPKVRAASPACRNASTLCPDGESVDVEAYRQAVDELDAAVMLFNQRMKAIHEPGIAFVRYTYADGMEVAKRLPELSIGTA